MVREAMLKYRDEGEGLLGRDENDDSPSPTRLSKSNDRGGRINDLI